MARARRLRALLALVMVPVVLLSTPQSAAAAGAWQQVSVGVSVDNFDDPTCVLNLRLDDSGVALELGSNSACKGGVDYTPGAAQPGEAGRFYIVSVSGYNDDNDACVGTLTGILGSHPSNGTTGVAGSFGTKTIALGGAVPCVVKEVCVTFPGDGALEGDHQGCNATTITGPQPADGECIYGNVHGVRLLPQYRQKPGSQSIWEYWWEIELSLSDASRYDLWRVTKQTTASSDHHKVGISTLGNVLVFPQAMFATTNPEQIQQLLTNTKPQGVQVYVLDNIRNTGTTYDPSSMNVPASYPITYPDGTYRGLTEPHQCRFWYGPKIVDFPTTESDEPANPLDVVDLPTEEEEPEVETPPTEWEPVETENSFWSLIAGLLRLILGAVKAIVGAVKAVVTAIGDLVAAIGDKLLDLFVPDGYVMEGHLDSVQDAWDDTTPMRYVDAVSEMQTGAVSGCGGLPLQMTLPGGVVVDERIGAACSGTMANVASLVRMVVSAALVIGGTFACVRAIGSGLNWNPGIGTGGST